MASPVPMIGAIVRKNERIGMVDFVGQPFPDGTLAIYVVGINSNFADWWLLDDVVVVNQERYAEYPAIA